MSLSIEMDKILRYNNKLLEEMEELKKQRDVINEQMKRKEEEIVVNRKRAHCMRANAEEEKMAWIQSKQGELYKLS